MLRLRPLLCLVLAMFPAAGSSGTPQAVLFKTSFAPGDGWNADARQIGTGCGSGFGGKQPGISDNGAWKTGGQCDEVIAAANNPSGLGGRGFRHWRGDGQNANGGGMTITLPSASSEVYVRVMIRYQAGFRWTNSSPGYIKDLYWGACGSGCVIMGYVDGGWSINYDNVDNHVSSLTWKTLQGGLTGDGRFHCFEYHVRRGSPGRVELRVDGKLYLSKSANLGTGTMSQFMLGENQSNPSNGDAHYTDYDDLVVSGTGWVGCGA